MPQLSTEQRAGYSPTAIIVASMYWPGWCQSAVGNVLLTSEIQKLPIWDASSSFHRNKIPEKASKLSQKIFFSLGMILWLKLAHIQRYTLSVVWGSIISHIINMGSTCICYVLVAQTYVRIQILSTESTCKVCLCVFLLSFHWVSILVGSNGGGCINIKSE